MVCIGWGSAAQCPCSRFGGGSSRDRLGRAAAGNLSATNIFYRSTNSKVPIAPIMFISCAAQSSVERVELDATQYLEPSKLPPSDLQVLALRNQGPASVSRTELPIAGPISKRRVLHQMAGILYHTGLLSNLTGRSASQT
ncbi:hypothetical protein A9K55_005838 [Cordyceps militaris]|uniref:Uncharacterized protein n=1 Tax=Cordyceps militaris TaxID=73501 RepID=A0A2H4SA58_CORMI|nr:hypothetical protein A9K55_005838 [Cordyceps militaris]